MMRCPVYFLNTNETSRDIMNYRFRELLIDAPRFEFEICDVIEEDEAYVIVSYPELDLEEPLLHGPTQLVLNLVNEKQTITVPSHLESPTWKDILNSINESIKLNNITSNLRLRNLEVTGLTEEGMGHIVEALLF